MVEEINAFIRYHFQDNSIYADKVVEGGEFATACSDTLGVREKVSVTGGADRLTVQDKRGHRITIDATQDTRLSNVMARDYVIHSHKINTSSFAVVHLIDGALDWQEPLSE